jgi:hypothetical protein
MQGAAWSKRLQFAGLNPGEVTVRAARLVWRFALPAVLAAAMAGCAGSNVSGSAASVTGDAQGGKVPYAEGRIQTAMEAAQAHCGQFGKKAQVTQMSPAAEDGGTVGFQCR